MADRDTRFAPPHILPSSKPGPAETDPSARPPRPAAAPTHRDLASAVEAARKTLDGLKDQLLAAALEFADGTLSVGESHFRSLRDRYRAQQARLDELLRAGSAPEPPPPSFQESPEISPLPPAPPPAAPAPTAEPRLPLRPLADSPPPDAGQALADVERKLRQVEGEFRAGRINAQQYDAIVKHYHAQREAARRLMRAGPGDDRWSAVLAEGKTTFLRAQLEAHVTGFAIYDLQSQRRLFMAGALAAEVEASLPLLSTFRPPGQGGAARQIFGTDLEDGRSVSLIVGEFTAALAIFSQRPPHWQLNACNEIHLNFEAANRGRLRRGVTEPRRLVFPDLGKVVKGT